MNDGADLEANKDGQSKKGEKAALETPDNRGKLSLHQERYIQKITSSTSKRNSSSNPLPLWHRPQLEFAFDGSTDKCPDVDAFYVKPVFLCAPHLTWPKLHLSCPTCKQQLSPKGWQSNPRGRYVHDLIEPFYLVEYQYICKSSECTTPLIKNKTEVTQKEKKMLAHEILESLPDWVRAHWPIGAINKRSAYSISFLSYLTTGVTTGASIEQVVKMSGTLRATQYLQTRLQYSSAKRAYEDAKEACKTFSDSLGASTNSTIALGR